MMNRVAEQQQRQLEKECRKFGYAEHNVTDEEIVEEFGNAAEDLTWRAALLAVGGEYGLIDVDGAPKVRWERNIIAKGYNAHRRTRAQALEFRAPGDKSPPVVLRSPANVAPKGEDAPKKIKDSSRLPAPLGSTIGAIRQIHDCRQSKST